MMRTVAWILTVVVVFSSGEGLVADEIVKIDWQTLSDAGWAYKGGGMPPMGAESRSADHRPDFGEELESLDGKVVALKGFIVPLELGAKQQRFILSKYPLEHCRFCQPGGAQSMVDVQAKQPLEFGYEAVVLAGKLRLVREKDPMGLLFRLTEATPID